MAEFGESSLHVDRQAMAPNSVDQRSGALLWEAAIDLGRFLSRHQTRLALTLILDIVIRWPE